MLPDTLVDNRYRIIKSLGDGGMANVYLAHDEFLNRDVTFKMMRLDMKNDVDLAKRFQREALSVTELINDNIVQVYDVGEYQGSQYIVMEYVDGTNLKSYIGEHFPIAYQQVVDIMMQILNAVQAAHNAGIIHRDLKPQNILIDRNDQVKITDFGIAIAKSEQDLTQTHTVIGSVHYLSPEQTRGGMASAKSDIYALGVMLYEMLTKQVPYEGDTPVAVALKHATADMPSVRDFDPRIPQALENVILQATAKNPQDRYLDVSVMAEDLKTVLSPRRSNEQRFAPTADIENETRIIPMEQIQDQLKNGVSSVNVLPEEVPEEPSVKDLIIEYGKKGYAVKSIAKIVDRTPNYVRSVLRGNGIKYRENKLPKILAFAVLFIVAIIAIFAFIHIQASQITVPSLSNLTRAKAEKKIQEAGLNVGSVTSTTSTTIKKGSVVRSTPKEGTDVKKGDSINLVISSGKAKVRFGDYVGSDYDVTAAQLRSQGYEIQKEQQASDSVAAGIIIAQSINANGKVDPTATKVTFTVSTGPVKITVPDFTKSSTQSDVQNWASQNDVTVNFNTTYSNSVKKDHVISQSIRGGSKITKDNTLLITISQGPEQSSSSSSSSSSSRSSSSSSSSSTSSEDSSTTSSDSSTSESSSSQ